MNQPSSKDWTVENEYRSRMSALKPWERVERSVAMFTWTRNMIARQIIAEQGEMSFERLRWKVALRMYANEPEVCKMITEELKNVPD